MAAQRKPVDQALTAPLEDTAPVERVVPVDYQSPRTADGELPTSPAILLQEQLAARIAGAERAQDAVNGTKWPMPLRIATIVGLSLALWGGIFFGAVAVLT